MNQPSPASNAEPEVSRVNDFDQSVKHDHRPGIVCPAGDWPTPKAFSMGKEIPPHVSPAILEFRIKELESDLEDAKAECRRLREISSFHTTLSFQREQYFKRVKHQLHYGPFTGEDAADIIRRCNLDTEEVYADATFSQPPTDNVIQRMLDDLKAARERLDVQEDGHWAETNELLDYRDRIKLRDKRIVELEGLVTSLAKHIDIMDAETVFVTGNSLAEHAEKAIEKEAA